jgi:hypothetical protein
MYEKCITCDRIGESCVPNLMRLSFADLMQWCNKRQKHLEWSNQTLADVSKVPVGTINRMKAGNYLDCKYATIRNIVIALIGGTIDEFPCNAQVEKELEQVAKIAAVEAENEAMKLRFREIDELHRQDVRAIRAEYQEQIAFLKDQLKAWQSR